MQHDPHINAYPGLYYFICSSILSRKNRNYFSQKGRHKNTGLVSIHVGFRSRTIASSGFLHFKNNSQPGVHFKLSQYHAIRGRWGHRPRRTPWLVSPPTCDNLKCTHNQVSASICPTKLLWPVHPAPAP